MQWSVTDTETNCYYVQQWIKDWMLGRQPTNDVYDSFISMNDKYKENASFGFMKIPREQTGKHDCFSLYWLSDMMYLPCE